MLPILPPWFCGSSCSGRVLSDDEMLPCLFLDADGTLPCNSESVCTLTLATHNAPLGACVLHVACMGLFGAPRTQVMLTDSHEEN